MSSRLSQPSKILASLVAVATNRVTRSPAAELRGWQNSGAVCQRQPSSRAIQAAFSKTGETSPLHSSNSSCSIDHRISSVVPDRAVHSCGANKTLLHLAADHALLAPFHVKSPTQRFITLEVQLVSA